MALLQWSDVRGMWLFNGPFTALLKPNGLANAQGPTIFTGFQPAVLRTSPHKDVLANYQNADSGYRASYGRYYRNLALPADLYSTDGIAGWRDVWDGGGTPLLNFTYGFVFRDISTNTGSSPGRFLMNKTGGNGGISGINGVQLRMDRQGVANDFEFGLTQAAGIPEWSIINSVPKQKWIIGYAIKADGVQSKIGLKVKGETSWTTANSGASAITVAYDTTKNATLMGLEGVSGFWGDMQAFCVWGVAITEATVQAQLEDHFGIADAVATAATPRSSILS